MEKARSKPPLAFFAGVLILSIVAVFLLVNKCTSDQSGTGDDSSAVNDSGNGNQADPNDIDLAGKGFVDDDATANQAGSAEDMVGRIVEVTIQANNSKDAQALIDLLGQHNLSPEQIRQLSELAANSRLQLDPSQPFSQLPGEPNRWAINLADKTQIHIALSKTAEGKWQVSSIALPASNVVADNTQTEPTKPEETAKPKEEDLVAALVRQFMDDIIRLDPAAARQYIDSSKISYATLAGLCIIFEEGDYALLQEGALRKMFLRENTSGWLARLKSENTGKSAEFAINVKRKDAASPWKITEINLDNLLTDYAKRMLGGDIHYSPLIKNPRGGDSLAIYFDLDAKDLIPRTKRQLAIVANLLKADKDKKLTITGHTDALGTDIYNLSLSRERADAVMRFLAESGVAPQQMNIVGYGETRPRLPNTADDGSDSPEGRRANRRAEILLDF